MSTAKPASLHIAVTGLTCGFGASQTRPAVLAVHAAGYLPVLRRRVRRHDGRLVMTGWLLLAVLMRPAPVRVARSTVRRCLWS
jgi:hypothetical protein